MIKKTICLSIAALMVAVSGFAELDRDIRIQNVLRVGYDDNIYQDAAGEESAEIVDALNISGKLNFSTRSDAVFSYQPEVRYRFDGDPKTITLQDAYARFNHALSPRVFLVVSDRFRYQLKDAQSGAVSRTDANYMENNLMGSLDLSVSEESQIKLGGGYEFRIWDDDFYGETLGNNYDQYSASISGFRAFNQEMTQGMLGADYTDVEYDSSRGSLDYITVMTGVDHVFNPNMTGFGRVGASFGSIDSATGSEDNTTPYLDTGIDYNVSERTSFNGGVGYMIARAENSIYNAQDQLQLSLGVRHDLTAKINVASTLAYTMSWYDSTYAINGAWVGLDVEDAYIQWTVRGSYQINRNNFVEIGYEFTDRSINNGGMTEWDRNRVDLGWRLRL
jgi:opacity protein-like surface antigen